MNYTPHDQRFGCEAVEPVAPPRAMGLAPDRAETPQAAQGRSPAGPVTAEGGQAPNTLWDKLEAYFEAEDLALLAAFGLTRETKGNV